MASPRTRRVLKELKAKNENNVSSFYYRPQRSCGQGYVFTGVCDSVHGGGLRRTPPDQGEPPLGPRRTPPGTKENPPGTKENPPRTKENPPRDQGEPPPDQGDPPGPGRPPLREEDCSIRSMSGRYASYWNAILLLLHPIPQRILPKK